MLIWLNGAFGAGKTSLAFELQTLHPRALIFDPEELGFALRRAQKPAPRGDFQDDPLWRELVFTSLERLMARETRPVIVPMTLVNALYFEEIVGELRHRGVNLHHFALLASPETLRARLRRRGEWGEGFAAQNLERCVATLNDPLFAEHLATDDQPVEALARAILERLELSIAPSPETPWQRHWRRWRQWRQSWRL